MALAIGAHQQALHISGKAALDKMKLPKHQRGDLLPIAQTKAQEPLIPSPAIFKFLYRGNSSSASEQRPTVPTVPTVAECAVHLELLQCFYALRSAVLKSTALDQTFGIKANPTTITRRSYRGQTTTLKKKDPTFATRRKEKWPLFLGFAVARFEMWIIQADAALSKDPTTSVVPPLGK
jgi:hypothetical protein